MIGMVRRLPRFNTKAFVRNNPTGNLGSGVGKGGGAGGTVRESGGGLGQYGAAQEEQFFYNKQREQLKEMKKRIKETHSDDGLTRNVEK